MLGLIFFGMLAALAPQDTTAVADEDEGEICLAIATMWRGGDNRDIQQIETVPVPASYRRNFEAGGCARWQLVEDGLIDWHLAFGSERSTIAALAYMERDHFRTAPDPRRFAIELRRAWDRAQREYAPLAAMIEGEGAEAHAAVARFRRSPSVRRLQELVAAHKQYLFLAEQYLRAAEAFESSALLDRAAFHFGPARDGFALIYRGVPTSHARDSTGLARHIGLWEWQIEQFHDVEMRLPILRARFSRSFADIDAAQTAIDRNFRPLLREAVDRSAGNAGAICDDDDEEIEMPDPVQAACATENYIPWRVINFWRSQLHLDMIKASLPERYGPLQRESESSAGLYAPGMPVPPEDLRGRFDLEAVTRLLDHAQREHLTGPSRGAVVAEDLILLYMARADLFTRQAQSVRLRDQPDAIEDLRTSALDDLLRAARLAPPAERPTFFRRIAERYLALFELIRSRAADEDRPRRYRAGDQARQAVFFRTVLAALDRIAIGEIAAD